MNIRVLMMNLSVRKFLLYFHKIIIIIIIITYSVFIIDQYFEDIVDQTEKWYGIKYKIDKIPDSILEVG